MLTAEREPLVARPAAPVRRSSPGFSLGEATRIRRDILAQKTDLECPRCAGRLGTVRARTIGNDIWIAGCLDCHLSLVVHCRPGDLA